MERDFDYENSNIGYYEIEECEGIKCKNYILCESILPNWWFECKGQYLCSECHMMFGTWGSGKNAHTGTEIGVLGQRTFLVGRAYADDVGRTGR